MLNSKLANEFMRLSLMKAILIFLVLLIQGSAQNPGQQVSTPEKEAVSLPGRVEIKPTARDSEIAHRLESILQATDWFFNPKVEVTAGVVFLYGEAKRDDLKKWAGELARSTSNVSAVVNKMNVIQGSPWDFSIAFEGIGKQWRSFIRTIPSLIVALIILLLTLPVARLVSRWTKIGLQNRISSPLLEDVLARSVGILVFLFGLYVIFQILGLTTIALTLLGGTGILGIILGIAFRDITENLLSSIFLSIHHPFRNGDLIEVGGFQGYVQKLTVRSTVLISTDGDHIQIPNSTIYKSNIRNYTVNPSHRVDFCISVKPENSISSLQEKFLSILSEHPAVLKDPEPSVLVEDMKDIAVVLRLYFWVNVKEHSWLKVKSSVMRGIRQTLADAEGKHLPKEKAEPLAIEAEGGLTSESKDIYIHAKKSRKSTKRDQNLLNS